MWAKAAKSQQMHASTIWQNKFVKFYLFICDHYTKVYPNKPSFSYNKQIDSTGHSWCEDVEGASENVEIVLFSHFVFFFPVQTASGPHLPLWIMFFYMILLQHAMNRLITLLIHCLFLFSYFITLKDAKVIEFDTLISRILQKLLIRSLSHDLF